LVFPFVLSRNI